jgi:hypothetical protein
VARQTDEEFRVSLSKRAVGILAEARRLEIDHDVVAVGDSLGRTFEALFARAEPFANVSLWGAAWFVADKEVTATTADAITLRATTGAIQRCYRIKKQLDQEPSGPPPRRPG